VQPARSSTIRIALALFAAVRNAFSRPLLEVPAKPAEKLAAMNIQHDAIRVADLEQFVIERTAGALSNIRRAELLSIRAVDIDRVRAAALPPVSKAQSTATRSWRSFLISRIQAQNAGNFKCFFSI